MEGAVAADERETAAIWRNECPDDAATMEHIGTGGYNWCPLCGLLAVRTVRYGSGASTLTATNKAQIRRPLLVEVEPR